MRDIFAVTYELDISKIDRSIEDWEGENGGGSNFFYSHTPTDCLTATNYPNIKKK
ncbi:MAG TPA: hypothetical protein VJ643_05560 [Nitrososphaera sp.]|nr:hypothetical protein [Nitrososphaera sp.]